MNKIIGIFSTLALFVGILRGQMVDISIIPSVGGPQHAASFGTYASNAVQALRTTGTLPVGVVGSPTDARAIEYLRAEDIMTTASTSFYGGVFNHTSPFNNERGATVWWWVVLKSRSAGNTVSLDMINASADSSDPQRSLRKETSLATGAYSPIAIGVRSDGSIINSGASSQLARTVIVGIGSKSYQLSDLAGVQSVQNYVMGNFSTTMTVTAGGSTASKTLSLVAPRPMLVSKIVGGIPTFELINNRNLDSFQVQLSDQLTGPWIDHSSLLKAGDRLQPVGGIKFLRYKP